MKKLLTAFVIILYIQATAQEAPVELDPVSVTASLQATKISQTGRNIISFKGDKFAQLPVHSIDELLRYLPGMEVQMRGPMGSQSDFVLRGGTFQQVLVLIDGVRVNDPNTGHFNSYIPIVPAEIDHIEVLKGASSAIYGSDAVGGVVHVITKAFAARQQQQSLKIQAQAGAGEYGLFTAHAGIFYQQKNNVISGGWLTNNTDGRLQRGTRGFNHNNTASLAFTHFFNSKWQLSLRTAYDKRDFSAQNFYTSFLSDTAAEQVSTFWNQARLAYTGNKHRLSLDIGYKRVKDEYLYNHLSIANLSKSSLLQSTITDEWKWRPKTTLVSGIQFIEKSIRSNDRGHHQLGQAAAFLIINQTIGNYLMIAPAIRVDHNVRSGTELIPQLNVSYKPGAIQWRASAGKTIRDADFTERFNNYNKPVVASGRIGDPDLDAERSFSYEGGADFFAGKAFKISAGFFQRLHRRLIDYTPTPYAAMPRKDNLVPGGTYALAKNIAKVNTTGVELDIQFDRNIKGLGRLFAGAGFVWMDSKSSDTVPSFYVSSHAKFMSNFFVVWSQRYFQLAINGVYKERSTQKAAAINAVLSKDYLLLNTKASFNIPKQRFSVFVQIDNILDRHYSDLLGAAMPGRWLMGGISFLFNRPVNE